MPDLTAQTRLTSFAPQFLVDDLALSMTYYAKLGFTFGEPWEGFYAIGQRDGLELHLKEAPKDAADRQHRRMHEHLDAAAGVDGIEAFYAECVARGATILRHEGLLRRGPGWTGPARAPRLRAAQPNPRRNAMLVEVQVTINGSKAAIWAAITNIEKASEVISGIENIEVLEKPAHGLVGLRWRETRMLFGRLATAEKRITDAAENEFYKTRAEGHGFVFLSTMSISEGRGGMTLTSAHDSQPQGIVAKLQSIPMGLLFKGVAKKALLQDLNDIKAAVESEVP